MEFKWKIDKNKKMKMEDKINNLAFFEVVLNILIMKATSGNEDIQPEVNALCGFAMGSMFNEDKEMEEGVHESIVEMKNVAVAKFKKSLFSDLGIPNDIATSGGPGEA